MNQHIFYRLGIVLGPLLFAQTLTPSEMTTNTSGSMKQSC